MISKREFVGRHGLPACYIFKGQYFDAGLSSKMRCSVCGADLRFCYILKEDSSDRPTPSTRKLTIGQECFQLFEGETLTRLKAAAVLLENAVAAEDRDKKVFQPHMEVRERREAWRALKRKALDVIREYKTKTGKEWLPEDLFTLKVVAEQQPTDYKRVTNAIRWYERQTQTLEASLQNVSSRV
jgi:hypothetical protein